jgi:hypothetical protein
MNLTSASHIGHQLDLHEGPSRQSFLGRLESCSCTMAALGFQALRSKTPRTRGGRLREETEAEAELEEGEIELVKFGGNAAGFVGRAAEWVAAVPYNSLLVEEVVVVVGVGEHYTRVGQQVGAVDIVVEGAAGIEFVAQALPT